LARVVLARAYAPADHQEIATEFFLRPKDRAAEFAASLEKHGCPATGATAPWREEVMAPWIYGAVLRASKLGAWS